MKNKTKKIVAIIMVMMTILSGFGNVFAMEIDSAEIYGKGTMDERESPDAEGKLDSE